MKIKIFEKEIDTEEHNYNDVIELMNKFYIEKTKEINTLTWSSTPIIKVYQDGFMNVDNYYYIFFDKNKRITKITFEIDDIHYPESRKLYKRHWWN